MKDLILVPTPIQDDLPLESMAREMLLEDSLKENVLILVEEHKIGRQRWLKWGLPREAIEKFILFNEHTFEKIQSEIIQKLKSGSRAYLLSDCGLPAFCDPGQKLVDACHRNSLRVTSTPFPNSIALSLALSGFSHERFIFCGFIPVKVPERSDWIKRELKNSQTQIWMETPYRLKKLIEELVALAPNREVFLAMNLNGPDEKLLRGRPKDIQTQLGDLDKQEFVLVLSPI
ncbi:MAG: SAM-dependent methyltransferase [Bacteriovoracaceae bacterium]